MSTDASISKTRTSSNLRKRSSSRSRISKTEQRPRASSKSRRTTSTEPRKSRTSKVTSKERSKSRTKTMDSTNRNVIKKETRVLDNEETSIVSTRMVLRKRPLPKDNGVETNRPITPPQTIVKETPKSCNECRMAKLRHHINTNKYLYLLTIIILIILTLIIFNGYDTQKYMNQFRIKIARFLETQRRKIST